MLTLSHQREGPAFERCPPPEVGTLVPRSTGVGDLAVELKTRHIGAKNDVDGTAHRIATVKCRRTNRQHIDAFYGGKRQRTKIKVPVATRWYATAVQQYQCCPDW